MKTAYFNPDLLLLFWWRVLAAEVIITTEKEEVVWREKSPFGQQVGMDCQVKEAQDFDPGDRYSCLV